jgi:diguanylate cyclase (GGDEF)-like protein
LSSHTATASDAQELRRNLDHPLGRLRFADRVESPFLEYLRITQHRSALTTAVLCSAVWIFYIALDSWRLWGLQGSGNADEFFWRSFAPRFMVLVCFACVLYALLVPNVRRRLYEMCVGGLVLGISLAVAASAYTLKNLAMHDTGVVMVLFVGVAFFPLGVRLRVMGPIAFIISIAFTVAGPLILRSADDLVDHWILTAVIWITFVLSGIAAYYREKSVREQYLLRHLLNWEASHDALTGLANRRMFREHMDRCMRLAQRDRVPMYLVIFDIDHFKLYNDQYGHVAGDKVLTTWAQLMLDFARRPLDLAVRLGGEEFAAVLYDISEPVLQRRLDGLNSDLAQRNIEHKNSPTAPYVTVSAGAAFLLAADTHDGIFQRADALLYRAKSEGRNRACFQSQMTDR